MPSWRPPSDNTAGPSRPQGLHPPAHSPSRPGPVPAPIHLHPSPRPFHASPAPGLHPSSPPLQQTQPKTIKLTPSALLSLPHRLVHPPPAKGKIPTWGLVPTFDIRLEDILDRKHLPPLGLKDFEEWLLFVDRAAENLYFILWLREYAARYTSWALQSKKEQEFLFDSSSPGFASTNHPIRTNLTDADRSPFPSHRNTTFCHSPSSSDISVYFPSTRLPLTNGLSPSPCPSPTPSPRRKNRHHRQYFQPPTPPNSLALFYLRAKETFLTPNAPYELDVPSDVLSVFHLSNSNKNNSRQHMPLAPPPDPAVFNELAAIIEEKLRQSLARFVLATYNNVGMPRAHCGSAGGLSIGILWSIPPLAANFSLGSARWWRLIALPGMWIGLTIFISAMCGVCMMIYVFGDLRQLRSFELCRPPISMPKPLSKPCRDKKLEPATMTSQPSMAPLTRPPMARIRSISVPSIGPALKISPLASRSSETAGEGANPTSISIPPVSVTRSSSRTGTVSEDGSLSSYSYTDSGSESETDSEGDSDSGSSVDSTMSRRKASGRRRHPQILISEAFYDEHPSPEGPATAAADFWSVGLHPSRGPTGAVSRRKGSFGRLGGSPLWPDYEVNAEGQVNATAAFIKPFNYNLEDYRFGTAPYIYAPDPSQPEDVEAQAYQRAAELQPIESFDFDALPPNRPRAVCKSRPASQNPSQPAESDTRVRMAHNVIGIIHADSEIAQQTDPKELGKKPREQKHGWTGQFRLKSGMEIAHSRQTDVEGRINEKSGSVISTEGATCVPGDAGDMESIHGYSKWSWIWALIGRVQSRCSPGNAVSLHIAHAQRSSEKTPVGELPSATRTTTPPVEERTLTQIAANEGACPIVKAVTWRMRFKKVSAVPPFASPLTPVLNPIVGRAQWEIVVRSALMSAVICLVVMAGLLCVPVRHSR